MRKLYLIAFNDYDRYLNNISFVIFVVMIFIFFNFYIMAALMCDKEKCISAVTFIWLTLFFFGTNWELSVRR